MNETSMNKPFIDNRYSICEVDFFGFAHGHYKLRNPLPPTIEVVVPDPNEDIEFINDISPEPVLPYPTYMVFTLTLRGGTPDSLVPPRYSVTHVKFADNTYDLRDVQYSSWFINREHFPDRERWLRRTTHEPNTEEEREAPTGVLNHTQAHFDEEQAEYERVARYVRHENPPCELLAPEEVRVAYCAMTLDVDEVREGYNVIMGEEEPIPEQPIPPIPEDPSIDDILEMEVLREQLRKERAELCRLRAARNADPSLREDPTSVTEIMADGDVEI